MSWGHHGGVMPPGTAQGHPAHRGLGSSGRVAYGASLLYGEMSLFAVLPLSAALSARPRLPSGTSLSASSPMAGPGTGAAGDSPTAPRPCQHGEVGVAGGLRGAQCWEIIPANPDHDGSAHQSVLALPFGANPDMLSLAIGASKDHTSITSRCHHTRSLQSPCRLTVPFSLFPMAQHTPPERPWVCPTAPRVGSNLILLLAGCWTHPLGWEGNAPARGCHPSCCLSRVCWLSHLWVSSGQEAKQSTWMSPQSKATRCPHIPVPQSPPSPTIP